MPTWPRRHEKNSEQSSRRPATQKQSR
jgi:hypothetical protein